MVTDAFRHVLDIPDDEPLFNPNQYAIVDWWERSDEHRVTQILGGERSGKSFLSAYFLAQATRPAERTAQGNLYWIVGPNYVQPRAEFMYIYQAFDYLNLVKGKPSMPLTENATWMFKTKLNGTYQTKTSYEVARLASFSLDAAIMAEAGQQVYEAYLKLLGRLTQTKGPLIISGTLEKGSIWFEDVYRRWQGPNLMQARSWSLPTWTNTAIYPGGEQDPALVQIRSEMPPDLYQERFGGLPTLPHGVVLPEFSFSQNVKHLDFVEGIPVELAIDPGQHCYAVLFIQHVGMVTHVLDRVYARGKIVQDVIPEVMGNPLWKHVVLRKAGVIDQAGSQHPASHSQVEIWQQQAGATLRWHYWFEDETINALRYRIGPLNAEQRPLVFFNDHMKNIRNEQGMALDVLAEPSLWRWPDRPAGKGEALKPVNRNNDAMKALGYKLLDQYGVMLEKRRQVSVVRIPYWGIPQRAEF